MTDHALLEERRSAREGLENVRETRNIPFRDVELREVDNGTGGKVLNFTGYACVTETGYEMQDWAGPYTEVIRSGAFTKTLSDGCDTCYLVNHEGLLMARTKAPEGMSPTLSLAEDSTGLHVDAKLNPKRSDVVNLREAVDDGVATEMSFAFRTLRQQWSPDWDQRDILEVSLDKGDVSVVNYGANPHTGGTIAMRRYAQSVGLTPRAFAVALVEVREGKTLSAATTETLQHCLDLFARADDAVDEGQIVLSDLLGVPNPDEPEDEQLSAPNLSLARARLRMLSLA